VAARRLKLRRPDACVECGVALAQGDEAWWDAEGRTVICLDCRKPQHTESIPPPSHELDRGKPGASLKREHQRRKRNRETRVLQAHPRIGGFILALGDAPQHEYAFHRGDLGEKAVAASLEARTEGGLTIALHNRRMPNGRGDIDHIAIAPTGVYVIDTKDWKGKVEIVRPWFGAPKLLINRRDCSNLLDGLERQIAAIRAVLDRERAAAIPTRGALCFTQADLPWLRTQELRGHLLLYRKALAKRLNAEGPLDAVEIERVARELATALPAA
jgi:hypothetical protein